MKVTQDTQFNPVTIVLETERELSSLYLACSSPEKTNRLLSNLMYDNDIMSTKEAKKVLNE